MNLPEMASPPEIYSILLLSEDGKTIPSQLSAWEENPDAEDMVKLSLACPGRKFETGAEDFFSAMIELRKKLEDENLLLMCYGASLNVYSSGMSRNMGSGEKAYKLTPGQPALSKDLVSIFGTGPDVKPSRIEEQEKFYLGWLDSLTRFMPPENPLYLNLPE